VTAVLVVASVSTSEGSGASAASPAVQATVTLLATLLIGGPLESGGATTSSSEVATGTAGPAAAAASSGPGGASNGSETSRLRGSSRSGTEEINLDQLADLIGPLQPALRSALGFLKKYFDALNGPDWQPSTPAGFIMKGLFNILTRPGQGAGAGAGPQTQNPGAGGQPAGGPPASGAPTSSQNSRDGTEKVLWDQGIDRLLHERAPNSAEALTREDTPAEAHARWAALFLASAVFHTHWRARDGVRSSSGKKTRSWPEV
jgi:hypothetical protein